MTDADVQANLTSFDVVPPASIFIREIQAKIHIPQLQPQRNKHQVPSPISFRPLISNPGL